MTPTAWIETRDLSKRFGSHQALDSLSLCVRQGEVFGFLGPNGAGKTTTLRILMGMLAPNSGQASILGLDCSRDRVEVKRRVGYLPDVPTFYDYLTGWELVRFVGRMHGLDERQLAERADLLMRELEIRDAADEFVTNYSLGMRKKIGLTLALIHDPDVLILDEPTTGLDPLGTRHIQNLIRSYSASGRAVLLSTHVLDMAERLCDRVAIVHRGKLVAEGPPRALRDELSRSDPGAASTLEEAFLAVTRGSAEERT